ncbi:MAG TPA: right-handed parallel beta-helix repeat-containing protein, partial [Planctomycetaceae bacterium]|nr:right-handed parallel beta-helix repeat-containing protein [Planctomycetaceae bacterium]
MNAARKFCAWILPAVFCVSAWLAERPAAASDPQKLYVATNGSDSNPGTLQQPLQTLGAAVAVLQDLGAIYILPGTYTVSSSLDIDNNSVSILAYSATQPVLNCGPSTGVMFRVFGDSVRIDGLILDGQFISDARAIIGSSAGDHLTISNCEIRNFADDAIDVNGPDCKIDTCHIHHILWWDDNYGGRLAANGIATNDSQRLTIRQCQIHQVSGCAFSGTQGAWSDVMIDQCNFYDLPLEADVGGFKKGACAVRNAVFASHATASRGRLTLKGSSFHGINSSFEQDAAALMLRDKIDVVIDSCDVSDSALALRLQGSANDSGALTTCFNCTIRNCVRAVRYENDLRNLHLVFTTFAKCSTPFQGAPSNGPWGAGWIVAENLFVGSSSLPVEAPSPQNVIPPVTSIDATTLHPTTSSGILGKPAPANTVPQWYSAISTDKDGVLRSTTTPTMGAFEYVSSNAAPSPMNVPPPQPAPVPPIGSYTLVSTHPRLLDFTTVPSKAGSPDGKLILRQVQATVDGGPDATGDRLLCGAFLVRYAGTFGVLPPGIPWKKTALQYRAQAIADLMSTPIYTGGYGTLIYTMAPAACGYDWLYNFLTVNQRNKLLGAFQSVMDRRAPTDKPASNQWCSSNNISGFGMTAALATAGEYPGRDYVADYYVNNWWKAPSNPPDENLFNWYCVRNNLAGGGNREGFGYYWGVLPNWASKAFWESATAGSNQALQNLAYFNQYPYWVLFQTDPAYKASTPIWSLHTIAYSGELDYDRSFMEFLMCSTSWSDDKGKKLARWLLDETLQYPYAAGSVGRQLLFGLLIGDPRVKGAAPSTLGLPLARDVTPYGEHFERSDWGPQATCFYFGCATHQSRVYPMNDLTVWSKGQPLICHGMHRY